MTARKDPAGGRGRKEIDILLAGIHNRYGYDFSHYSYASLKRRAESAHWNRRKLSALQPTARDALSHNEQAFRRLPKSHVDRRHRNVPRSPVYRAACARKSCPCSRHSHSSRSGTRGTDGKEAYSMAIVLYDEKLSIERAFTPPISTNRPWIRRRKGSMPPNARKNTRPIISKAGGRRSLRLLQALVTIWLNSPIR